MRVFNFSSSISYSLLQLLWVSKSSVDLLYVFLNEVPVKTGGLQFNMGHGWNTRRVWQRQRGGIYRGKMRYQMGQGKGWTKKGF